jgi:catechol 2,3-dioxygenase-like lactoylglutathione lyase family enzyme
VFDHLGFRVKDLAAARKFYDAVAASLGLATIDNTENSFLLVSSLREPVPFVWIGTDKPAFWRDGHRTSNSPLHLAFKAMDKPTVDAFHKAALQKAASTTAPPVHADRKRWATTAPMCSIPMATTSRQGFAQAEARSGPQADRASFTDD